MAISSMLAEWVAKTEHDQIPDRVIEKAKLHVLDTLGVMLGGAQEPVAKGIVSYVRDLGGNPHCSILGTSVRTSPPLAALANGVLGHALDFDDTSYSAFAHVSVTVLPAALGVGELLDASGKEVLTAYLIGSEVACKLGIHGTSLKLYENGWFSTCLIGAFGASAATAKLLRLTEDELVHAFAIVASEVSGILGNNGTMVKPFAVGRSAENGVVAALLAKRGIKGSPEIFEKPFGFCHAFRIPDKGIPFCANMGNPFEIDVPGFHLKEFPSCANTHPALNALIALIKHYSIEPDNVESIDCATTPIVVASLPYSNPHDVSQARFSMQFCLAVAALGRGEIKVDDFREERLSDPKVQGMMKRVTLRVAPEFEAKGFAPPDEPEAAVVEVRIKDGERYSTRRAFADWRPDHLPSMEALTKKYRDCASSTLSKGKVQGSIEVIQGLDRLDRIHKLITWLVP